MTDTWELSVLSLQRLMNLKLFQKNFELKSKVKNYKRRKKEKNNFNYTAIIIVFAEKIHHWIQKLVGKS